MHRSKAADRHVVLDVRLSYQDTTQTTKPKPNPHDIFGRHLIAEIDDGVERRNAVLLGLR